MGFELAQWISKAFFSLLFNSILKLQFRKVLHRVSNPIQSSGPLTPSELHIYLHIPGMRPWHTTKAAGVWGTLSWFESHLVSAGVVSFTRKAEAMTFCWCKAVSHQSSMVNVTVAKQGSMARYVLHRAQCQANCQETLPWVMRFRRDPLAF